MKRMSVAAMALAAFWTFTTPANAAGTVSLVSHVPSSDSETPNHGSAAGYLNAKGTKAAFTSLAAAGELVASGPADQPTDTEDVFLYDAATQSVRLISHTAGSQAQTANDESFLAGISPSGRFILIQSRASDLIPGFANADPDPDFYVYDTKKKKASLVSHVPGDVKTDSDGFSQSGVIGEKKVKRKLYPVVVFESDATDLVSGFDDQNGTLLRDVYRYDGKTKKVSLVTRDALDAKKGSASCGAFCPVHSGLEVVAGGRFVVYTSPAHNLVEGFDDNNGDVSDGGDVFIYDAKTKRTTLVSHTHGSNVAGGNGGSDSNRTTPNGRFITYRSVASDLLEGAYDNNGANRDIFLYDRKTGQNQLVSHKEGDPTQTGTGTAVGQTVSDDGRYVTFQVTKVDDFGDYTDANGTNFSTGQDIVQLDRQTGAFALVSRSAVTPGSGANAGTTVSRSTSDGRFVLFQSGAGDLVGGFDDNNTTDPDLFLWDRKVNTINVVSHAFDDEEGGADGFVYIGGLATKAPRVLFGSDASNLIEDFDDNDGTGADAFLYVLST